MKLNDYIYIYYIRDGYVIFRSSVSRKGLGPTTAKQRVDEYNKKGIEAFYTVGFAVPGALS